LRHEITHKYAKYIGIAMPYGLEDLWDRDSIAAYTSERGTMLRASESLEENATFVVRWASELYW